MEFLGRVARDVGDRRAYVFEAAIGLEVVAVDDVLRVLGEESKLLALTSELLLELFLRTKVPDDNRRPLAVPSLEDGRRHARRKQRTVPVAERQLGAKL